MALPALYASWNYKITQPLSNKLTNNTVSGFSTIFLPVISSIEK
jgi:hypothetical protein